MNPDNVNLSPDDSIPDKMMGPIREKSEAFISSEIKVLCNTFIKRVQNAEQSNDYASANTIRSLLTENPLWKANKVQVIDVLADNEKNAGFDFYFCEIYGSIFSNCMTSLLFEGNLEKAFPLLRKWGKDIKYRYTIFAKMNFFRHRLPQLIRQMNTKDQIKVIKSLLHDRTFVPSTNFILECLRPGIFGGRTEFLENGWGESEILIREFIDTALEKSEKEPFDKNILNRLIEEKRFQHYKRIYPDLALHLILRGNIELARRVMKVEELPPRFIEALETLIANV